MPSAAAAAAPAAAPAPAPAFELLDASDARAVARVAELVNACYRGPGSWTGERGIVRGVRITPAALAAAAAAPAVDVVVAARAGAVVGCVRTGVVRDTVAGPLRGAPAAYLGLLAVRPALQSAGVGGALVREVERRARDVYGCRRVVMDVLDCREDLLAWYARMGYKRTGEKMAAREFMRDKGEELLVECSFIVLEKQLYPAEEDVPATD